MKKAAISVSSTDLQIERGFAWAREQALQYAFSGDPVGDWYEASLPGRGAFCMRDVAHQAIGAELLGLSPHNRNMLKRFAENISDSRDWCSFWEITKDNIPAPVDYINDRDFWYNLPANFDVLLCCYKLYLWTGDSTYLDDPSFRSFYHHTMNDYIRTWDRDRDGIPDHDRRDGRRGIASYNEDELHPRMAGDLLALQFSAYRAYSDMQAWLGNQESVSKFEELADFVRQLYWDNWWDERSNRYAGCQLQDGQLRTEYYDIAHFMPVKYGLVQPGERMKKAVLDVCHNRASNVEGLSYIPEILFAYGYDQEAYATLIELMSPELKRREYPEVSFSVVSSIIAGLMGINVNARTVTVTTQSHLPDGETIVQATGIPAMGGTIQVRHDGRHLTSFTNQTGTAITWEARVGGRSHLSCPSHQQDSVHCTDEYGNSYTSLSVIVTPGETLAVTAR